MIRVIDFRDSGELLCDKRFPIKLKVTGYKSYDYVTESNMVYVGK